MANTNTDQWVPATYTAVMAAILGIVGVNIVLAQPPSVTAKLTRVTVRGVATAANLILASLVRYSALPTGGTGVAQTPVAHDPRSPAATAVLTLYTAAPAAGTVVGPIREEELGITAVGTLPNAVVWNFPTGPLEKAPALPPYNTTQNLVPGTVATIGYGLLLSAAPGAGGLLISEWSWQEELGA